MRNRRNGLRAAVALLVVCIVAVVASGALGAVGDINTSAGTGQSGFNGDNIPATSASLSAPVGIASTSDGGYLLGEQGSSRIRLVSPSGVITTLTSGSMSAPNGIAQLADGSVLFADSNNNRVQQVSPGGTVTTVAGNGQAGYNGDNIPATSALLNFPIGIAATPDGGYLIGDNDNNRIRKVLNGTITTVAGTGAVGAGGDGGQATLAQLSDPSAVSVTSDGGFLIDDLNNNKIRKVSSAGIITTVAGTGAAGYNGDNIPATSAQLNAPTSVTGLSDGGFLVADRLNNRVRRVDPNGIISTIAGNGTAGFAGDGGPATSSQLNNPLGTAVTTAGDFLIVDFGNSRVRVIDQPDAVVAGPVVPPPVLGKAVNVSVVKGTVRVAVPRKGKKLKFVKLRAKRQVPVGSYLDTKRGTVRLVSAKVGKGTQAGQFSAGIFRVSQSRKKKAKGLTELRMSLGSFKSCKPRKKAKKATAALSKKAIRRLRANAKGKFRTRGRYSAATVRGTVWDMKDRCDGTLTVVKRGTVAVRDFKRKKTVLLKKGKRYLAKAPG
jgi:hypothetical protein